MAPRSDSNGSFRPDRVSPIRAESRADAIVWKENMTVPREAGKYVPCGDCWSAPRFDAAGRTLLAWPVMATEED